MKIYIVVCSTEDSALNTVDVFQSAHLTLEAAKKQVRELESDFGYIYDVLIREVD
jgi:hypothetical protein